jgi:multidrug transporter EmrE-like cation transporter
MYVALILFGGGIFLTIGDIVFKYWAGQEGWPLYLFGMALYVCGLVPLVASYKYANIELASALLILFNIVLLTIVGWLYFHEKIQPLEVLGLLLAAAAILCLELAS